VQFLGILCGETGVNFRLLCVCRKCCGVVGYCVY